MAMGKIETWDSLTHMDLVASVEEVFKITLDADDIIRMTDVQSIKNIVERKTNYNGN